MGKTSQLALITGVTGQDGSYLAQLLLKEGFDVIGVTRKQSPISNLNHIYLGIERKIKIVEADISNFSDCENLLNEYKPDEIYNLAAQSSVSISFLKPLETIQFNVSSVVNLLEAIRKIDKRIRYYQASSSEMFGSVNKLPISIDSILHPVSPYGISKATGHWLVSQYREAYGLFAVSGALFNHESFLRSDNFFVKKVITSALRMQAGKQDILQVGSIDVKRDFGSAKDYVKAIRLMLQSANPKDYLVCSGQSISLRDIIYHVFTKLDVDTDRIFVDESLIRPSEIYDIYGNPQPIIDELGWEAEDNFYNVLDSLIIEEQKNNLIHGG